MGRPAPAPVTSARTDGFPVQDLQVTRDGAKGPDSCSPQAVGELVVGFFGAVNAGEFEASRYFSPDMKWYSISEWSPDSGKDHFVTYGYEPEELEAHFESRIAENEQLHLLEIDVAYERERNIGHIVYALERRADDLPVADPIVIGKGAIDCHTGKISVWSMSHDARFQRAASNTCPGKPDPPETAIACARA